MMTDQDTAVSRYLRALEAALHGVPADARQEILDDVGAHFADAEAAGIGVDDTIRALGKPHDVAAAALVELGVAHVLSPAERARRTLLFSGVTLAVFTAVFVSFLMPSYAVEVLGVSSDQTRSTLQSATSLFEYGGLGVAMLSLIPVLIAALPLIVPHRFRAGVTWGSAGVMTVLSAIAGFSIGGFFLPLTAVLWSAALLPFWVRKGASSGAERASRIIGAVVLAVPPLAGVATAVTGVFRDPMLPFWIAALVLLALAVLFALRVRFPDAVVTLVGLGMMMLALFDAGVLTLAVWLLGATWLVAGLCGLVSTRARRTLS